MGSPEPPTVVFLDRFSEEEPVRCERAQLVTQPGSKIFAETTRIDEIRLHLRWLRAPGPAVLSPGPVRTFPQTCRPPPSSRADRTASRATPSTSACSWV